MNNIVFPRTISRLAAIQATFQSLLRPSFSTDEIIQDFLLHRFTSKGYAIFQEDDSDEYFSLDQDFFIFITKGAQEKFNIIESIIVSSLPQGWSMQEMENTTRAIFRCAGFEIQACRSTPKRVILNEYIMAAHCFLLDKGHALVNAVLDKAFTELRLEDQDFKKNPLFIESNSNNISKSITNHQTKYSTDILDEDFFIDKPQSININTDQDISISPGLSIDLSVDFIAPTTLPSNYVFESFGTSNNSNNN